MAKKTKTPSKTKRSSTPTTKRDQIDSRKKLLSRVAGNVAAGLVGAPSPSISSADSIATVAVDIAEQILRKAGIAAETTSETTEVPAAAAS